MKYVKGRKNNNDCQDADVKMLKWCFPHKARKEKFEKWVWDLIHAEFDWAREEIIQLWSELRKFLIRFVQLIPRRAENGWSTVLTLTTSSVAQTGDTNASVKFSLMTNEVCFPIRNILIQLIPSFLVHTHSHFSLFIRKGPSPKDLPDSKADPCWHPRLLKDTAVVAAPIRSIWKLRWDAVREKKNVKAVLRPTAITFPSPNTSKTQHLYKQPVRGTEGVTQQLRVQLVHDAQPAALWICKHPYGRKYDCLNDI